MKNRVYFLGLNFLSILLLFFTYRKMNQANKRYFFPLYLAFTGINYFFEFIVLVLTKAYEYDPKILKKQYFDNVFGATVSQLFVVPTTSLLMNLLNLNAKWPTLLSILMTGLDKFFVKQKVYKHFWWKTPFTTVGIQLFYVLAKFWTIQIIERKNKWFELMTVYFAVFVSYATMNFFHVALFKTCFFHINLYRNPYRSHVATSSVYSGISALIFMPVILYKKWYVTLLSMSLFISLETLFIRSRIITISSPPVFYSISFLTKLFSILIGNYVLRLLKGNTSSSTSTGSESRSF